MKKFTLALLIVFAALCSAGCSSSEESSFRQDSAVESATESGTTETSPDQSEPQNRLEEESDIQDPDPADQENNAEAPAGINPDLLSELGMTFTQLTEKYGEPRGAFNVYEFGSGAGYGRYGWKSDEGKYFDDMESAGGCDFIVGIEPEKLFLGVMVPMELDELSDRYDLVPVSVDSEIGMDDGYRAEFASPLYENVSFIFSTGTYGSIGENTRCTVVLNVDCEKAVPVI